MCTRRLLYKASHLECSLQKAGGAENDVGTCQRYYNGGVKWPLMCQSQYLRSRMCHPLKKLKHFFFFFFQLLTQGKKTTKKTSSLRSRPEKWTKHQEHTSVYNDCANKALLINTLTLWWWKKSKAVPEARLAAYSANYNITSPQLIQLRTELLILNKTRGGARAALESKKTKCIFHFTLRLFCFVVARKKARRHSAR